MRRRHAIPPGCCDHYQDLGISSLAWHDSACYVMLSVACDTPCSYGLRFFCEAWNVFDFIIVAISVCELLFPLPVNPSLVRLFRLFRLARMLR